MESVDFTSVLPFELIHHIFTFLDVRSIGMTVQLNRVARMISDDQLIWKHLFETSFGNGRYRRRRLPKLKGYKEEVITNSKVNQPICIPKFAPSYAPLERIVLGSFSIKDLPYICTQLKKNQYLKDVEIGANFGLYFSDNDRDTIMPSFISVLFELNLRSIIFDNPFMNVVANQWILETTLKSKTLKTLGLPICTYRFDESRKNIAKKSRLKKIILYQTGRDLRFAGQLLKLNKHLRELVIRGETLLVDKTILYHLRGMANAIRSNTTLKSLEINFVEPYTEHLEFLFDAIANNISLNTLVLKFPELTYEPHKFSLLGKVDEILKSNKTLKRLTIWTNIECKANDVYSILRHTNQLSFLDLSGLTNFRSIGRPIISKDIAFETMTLSLLKDMVTNTSIKELQLNIRHIGYEGASLIADILRSNDTLKTLSINFTNIQNKGFAEICDALCANTTLISLNILGNKPRALGASALIDVFMKNKTLETLRVNQLPKKTIGKIMLALSMNNTLLSLDMPNQNVPNVSEVEEMLKNNTTLAYFSINRIDHLIPKSLRRCY